MEQIGGTTPVARKEHTCSFCEGIIPVGEKYYRQFCKFDGVAYAWKSHINCQRLADKMMDTYDWDEGISQDDFFEFVTEKCQEILKDSEDFPKLFSDRLAIVLKHYKIIEQ